MAVCGMFDFDCKIKDFAASAIGDALTNAANATLEAVGKALASLGTIWVNIGTPNLTTGGGGSNHAAGSSAPTSGGIETVLGYVTWISFGVAVLSLIALGVRLGRVRRGVDTGEDVTRLGLVLGSVVVIASATGVISALLPQASSGGSPAVAYIQNSLWWYMAAAAILSIIIGGARMAWEQRAQPGKDLLRSLLTLVVVSGASLTIIGLLVAAADSFSVWLINGSLDCDVTNSGGTCFGGNMAGLLALTTNPAVGGLGAILIIVLGLVAVLVSVVQIILMLARGGMLVILAGILPTAAAATNTEMGRSWFKKSVSWLVAFILYKPAAAIIYATAFKLAGTSIFKDDGTGLISVLTGLTLMVIALVALPALMRFVTPMVGALAGGGAAATMALAGAAMLPTGAAQIGRLMGGGSGGGGGGSTPSPSSPQGSGTGGTGKAGATGSTGASGTAGSAGSGAGSGAAASGAGGAAAAAGPVGVAVAAGAMAAQKVGQAAQAAAGAAQSIGESSTGEGGGPNGSR